MINDLDHFNSAQTRSYGQVFEYLDVLNYAFTRHFMSPSYPCGLSCISVRGLAWRDEVTTGGGFISFHFT